VIELQQAIAFDARQEIDLPGQVWQSPYALYGPPRPTLTPRRDDEAAHYTGIEPSSVNENVAGE
jgi:hypothetical protein